MIKLAIQSKTTAAMKRDLGWMRFPDDVVVVVDVIIVAVEGIGTSWPDGMRVIPCADLHILRIGITVSDRGQNTACDWLCVMRPLMPYCLT